MKRPRLTFPLHVGLLECCVQAVRASGACPAAAARSPHVVNNDGDHGPAGQRKAIYVEALGPCKALFVRCARGYEKHFGPGYVAQFL